VEEVLCGAVEGVVGVSADNEGGGRMVYGKVKVSEERTRKVCV